MKICGIIAEYNPLHNGHLYQIQQARKTSGCDHLIVAMSGSFVQRGEVAAYNKFERAKWVIQAGADLVYEIPAVYCVQAASGYALGGVSVLANAGANQISFGSEIPSVDRLHQCARILSDHANSSLAHNIKSELAQGKSYPRSVHAALKHEPGFEEIADALLQPNFMLGVEYLMAQQKLGCKLEPFVVRRLGDGHNAPTLGTFASANAIRTKIIEVASQKKFDQAAIIESLPDYVYHDVCRQDIAQFNHLEAILLYCLRTKKPAHLSKIFAVDEGFENKLLKAGQCVSYDQILEFLKSKRYTLARIKRALCAVLLDIDKEMIKTANSSGTPYLRVLAQKRGSERLLNIASKCQLPVIIAKRDTNQLGKSGKQIFETDILATDIQTLAYPKNNLRTAHLDYSQNAIKL